jgi:VWFA-related protein
VLVDVAVTRGDVPVPGLTVTDFTLLDEGVPQDVTVANSADRSISAVLDFDVSASTQGSRLTDLMRAGGILVDDLKPGDSAALATFNDRVVQLAPLTPDLAAVRSALNQIVPSGQTALFDGVYAGLVLTSTSVGTSLVVVYTDGKNTVSWLRPDEVMSAANHLNAVIDAVIVRNARSSDDLRELVQATGGEVVVIDSTSDLGRQFARLLRDFRSRYQLTFVPHGVRPGGFHHLEVKVRGSGLTVHARAGYVDASQDLPR